MALYHLSGAGYDCNCRKEWPSCLSGEGNCVMAVQYSLGDFFMEELAWRGRERNRSVTIRVLVVKYPSMVLTGIDIK